MNEEFGKGSAGQCMFGICPALAASKGTGLGHLKLCWAAGPAYSVVWLTLDTGCQLGAQLRLWTRAPGCGLSSMAVFREFDVLLQLPPE